MKKPQSKSINHVGIISSVFVAFLFSPFVFFGQVGIGTTNPNATLDVRSSNQAMPANTDGIIIPKIDNFPSVNPTVTQDGMLLFATGNGIPNKGFYYWDNTNTSWVPITTTGSGSGGNTLDQAYDQGGAGLGKNINATNGAVRINGTDGFLVTGEVFYGNPIDAEITGAGTRMFFNPLMSAFRAGTVWDIYPFLGDEWDVANTGLFSTAFGVNTTASGLTSTAFGNFATASGNVSMAFGSGTLASEQNSTAFGYNTTASGAHSVSFGYETTASETTTTAFGSFTSASGTYATAFGYQSVASGLASIAFGTSTNASGERATAFGVDTEASANNSTAFGTQTLASGSGATAFGSYTLASGSGSASFGYGTMAPSSNETALGMYNTIYTPVVSEGGYSLQDRIFVVGNGISSSQRNNALTIYKSGLTIIDNTLGIGTNTPTATLSVNGIANKPGGGTWAVFSDRSLKENINSYNEGLDFIMKIRPVNFQYNEKLKNLSNNVAYLNNTYQGVIAQELQNIAPDMVREVTVENETFLEVDPNKFTYALINAVKEQQHIIKNQNSKIETLELQLKQQQNDIEMLKLLIKKY